LVSLQAGCAFIAAWNCCSWPIEFYLLKVVYDAEPGLAKKELVQEEQKNDGRIKSTLYEAKKAWMAYGRQPVLGAAIAMALLYMTILSFDQVTNGYVYSQGVPENLLAVAQGVGSLSGILGTLIFPALRNRIGIRWAGLLSLCLELLCLSPSVVSIWLNGSPFDPDAYFSPTVSPTENYVSSTTAGENKNSKLSVIVLLGSIVSARCGLWMADLAITQLMQQAASPSERGAVFGVQSGLQQLMSMLKNAMAIALPLPSTFGILILASYSSITMALLTYILFMIRTASTTSRKEKEKDHFTSL